MYANLRTSAVLSNDDIIKRFKYILLVLNYTSTYTQSNSAPDSSYQSELCIHIKHSLWSSTCVENEKYAKNRYTDCLNMTKLKEYSSIFGFY